MDKKKKFEIIKGNISDLELSEVSEHITPAKPKSKVKADKIIIPKGKKNK